MSPMDEMGNPQGKVSEIEYGWLAGFFDGEGTICITIRPQAGKNRSPKVQPMVALSSTDLPGLNAVSSILDRVPIGYHVAWATPKGFTKAGGLYKAAWSVKIVGLRRTSRFLEWISPALHTKRERAEVCLQYIGLRLGHSDHRTPLSELEWSLVMQLKSLNSKGQPFTKEVLLNTERPGASSEQLAANGRKGAEARWGPSVTTFND